MSLWVLAISIGPVGRFVAAGRRSRDLWYGSKWLSDTTAHVARHLDGRLREVDGALVLPTTERLQHVAQRASLHGGRVSNKVLAVVRCDDASASAALGDLAQSCRQAATEFLVAQIEALTSDPRMTSLVDRDALSRQIEDLRAGDFIEFSAAWARHHDASTPTADPFTPPNAGQHAGFGSAVARACDLRDASPKFFDHPSFSRMGVERSHLDEGRDTVLAAHTTAADRGRAGLIENEQLDAIGLLRRASPYLRTGSARPPTLPFPPLARVAAHPWIAGLDTDSGTRSSLRALRRVLERAAADESFDLWCSRSREPGPEVDENDVLFPFDASMLFEGGADALHKRVRRLALGPSVELDEALRLVRELHRRAGAPPEQYYAFLELDGDGVGRLLASVRDQPTYQRLIRSLDAFADEAANVITIHEGLAVYVAGDELTAYVPVDRALALVVKLDALYRTSLEGFRAELGAASRPSAPQRDSVSAGVVIAHVKDDLRGVRARARRALALAKERSRAGRSEDGTGHVALVEMPRGAADRWTAGPIAEIAQRLESLRQALHHGAISLRTEQILRDHRDRFQSLAHAAHGGPGVLLAQDAVRQQSRRAGRDDAELPGLIDRLETWHDVERLADELRIASRIAGIRAQRGPERGDRGVRERSTTKANT